MKETIFFFSTYYCAISCLNFSVRMTQVLTNRDCSRKNVYPMGIFLKNILGATSLLRRQGEVSRFMATDELFIRQYSVSLFAAYIRYSKPTNLIWKGTF